MATFEELSAREYAEHLLSWLLTCEQTPIHDAACYVPTTSIVASPVPDVPTMLSLIIGLAALFWIRKIKS